MKTFTCEKCGTSIKLHFIKGYVHLCCPACGAEYQLDTGSLKKYMLISLLSVATAVGTSLRFLQGRTIDIECIYILIVFLVLSGPLGTLYVKTGLLTYEEKGNRQRHEENEENTRKAISAGCGRYLSAECTGQ